MKRSPLYKNIAFILFLFTLSIISCNKDDSESSEENNPPEKTLENLVSVTLDSITLFQFKDMDFGDEWDEGEQGVNRLPDIYIEISTTQDGVLYRSPTIENLKSPREFDVFGAIIRNSPDIDIVPDTPIALNKENAYYNSLRIKIMDEDLDDEDDELFSSFFGSTSNTINPVFFRSSTFIDTTDPVNEFYIGTSLGFYFTHIFN